MKEIAQIGDGSQPIYVRHLFPRREPAAAPGTPGAVSLAEHSFVKTVLGNQNHLESLQGLRRWRIAPVSQVVDLAIVVSSRLSTFGEIRHLTKSARNIGNRLSTFAEIRHLTESGRNIGNQLKAVNRSARRSARS
jgi:hypothetical protein